jgi:hypothetical protein
LHPRQERALLGKPVFVAQDYFAALTTPIGQSTFPDIYIREIADDPPMVGMILAIRCFNE